MHSYFLQSADPTTSVYYHVDRIRDGKSFSTRNVAAKQHGKVIFEAIVSFKVSETSLLDHQLDMPPDLPRPEEFNVQKGALYTHPKLLEDGVAKHFFPAIRKTMNEEEVSLLYAFYTSTRLDRPHDYRQHLHSTMLTSVGPIFLLRIMFQ